MSIFKAYDIRGIYGQDLTQDVFYKIARAYAQFAKVGKVVVARDCRVHSKPLFDAFAQGLVDEGVDVIDIGLASTPMSYFANAFFKADGSVMITASHNTKEWNGCKLCRANAVPISGATGIKDIEGFAGKKVCFVDLASTSGYLYPSAGLIEAGAVTPSLERSYPLDQAPEAIRRLVTGEVRGKVAITV